MQTVICSTCHYEHLEDEPDHSHNCVDVLKSRLDIANGLLAKLIYEYCDRDEYGRPRSFIQQSTKAMVASMIVADINNDKSKRVQS